MSIASLAVPASSVVKSTTSEMPLNPFFDVLDGLNQLSRVGVVNDG